MTQQDPQKDRNKIEEERGQPILGLDRSGTVTFVPGAGIPDIVEILDCGAFLILSDDEF